jgi:hypothetical protein
MKFEHLNAISVTGTCKSKPWTLSKLELFNKFLRALQTYEQMINLIPCMKKVTFSFFWKGGLSLKDLSKQGRASLRWGLQKPGVFICLVCNSRTPDSQLVKSRALFLTVLEARMSKTEGSASAHELCAVFCMVERGTVRTWDSRREISLTGFMGPPLRITGSIPVIEWHFYNSQDLTTLY